MTKDTKEGILGIIITLVVAIGVVSLVAALEQGKIVHNPPHVDLPEEYELMSDETPIEGEYDPRTNTVTIKFKHDYGDNNN